MAGIAALCAAYVLSQFYRAFLAVLSPDLIADLGATKAELSTASGLWFLTFAMMQFGVGVSLDRFGPRRTAAWMLGVCGGAGAIVFALAQTPMMIMVAMGLFGIACSPVLMASLFIFARVYSPARFATLISVFIGIGTLGNIAGATPLAATADVYGWRSVVALIGVGTVLVAASILCLVRDPDPEPDSDGGGLKGYLALLRLRVLWPIFPLVAVNYAVAAGVRGLWAGPMMIDIHGADTLLIGQVTLIMALAMSVGAFVYGPLDSFFNTRKWVVFCGIGLGCVTTGFLAIYPQTPIFGLTVAFGIIGLTGMAYGVLMAHGRAFIPANMTGRGITLLNFFSIGGVSLVQIGSGQVVERSAIPGHPDAAYSALFWMFTISVAAALAIYLFARDAKPHAQ